MEHWVIKSHVLVTLCHVYKFQ